MKGRYLAEGSIEVLKFMLVSGAVFLTNTVLDGSIWASEASGQSLRLPKLKLSRLELLPQTPLVPPSKDPLLNTPDVLDAEKELFPERVAERERLKAEYETNLNFAQVANDSGFKMSVGDMKRFIDDVLIKEYGYNPVTEQLVREIINFAKEYKISDLESAMNIVKLYYIVYDMYTGEVNLNIAAGLSPEAAKIHVGKHLAGHETDSEIVQYVMIFFHIAEKGSMSPLSVSRPPII